MATVARVTQASVAPQPLPNVRGPSEMTGNETAGLVRGLESAAGVVGQIAQQAQEKADTVGVLEARRKLGDWERSWFSADNPNGVYARKGKEALGVIDDVAPDFETVQGEILQTLRSPKARDAFLSYAGQTRESMLNRINSYAVDENNRYVAEEFKASLTNSADRAAEAALDGRFEDQAREAEFGLQTLRSMQKINGESEDVYKMREQAFLTTVHSTAVNGLLAKGDINAASTYFDDNADMISPEAAGQLMARMKPLQDEAAAEAFVNGFESGGDAATLGGDLTIDMIWSSQIQQESGNRQVDANGVPITSSAGAIGVAQIMPDTGPIAAKYAGVAWDPVRFKTDKDYNMRLGRAYMEAQVSTFGSVQLGLAAYNAGPGAVAGWTKPKGVVTVVGKRRYTGLGDPRKGEISIDEFIAKIPYTETREYVQKITAKAGRGSAAPAGATRSSAGPMQTLDPKATLEDKLRAAQGITDLGRKRAIEQKIRDRHNLAKQAENEREAAVLEDVNSKVWAAPVGMPLEKIPGVTPDQIAFITQKGHRDNYERIISDRIQGTLPKTDAVLFETLRRQSVEDPDGFSKQRNLILANSHKFAADDYEMLLGRVDAINNPKKAGERADWATDEQRLANINRDLGIKEGPAGKDERAAVSRAYMDAERAFIQSNDGRKPTPEQRDAMALKVRQNLAEARANGVNIATRDARAAEFDGAVDMETKRKAAARLRARNGREPTDAEVLRYIADTVANRTQK
jgi:hypothetical protein